MKVTIGRATSNEADALKPGYRSNKARIEPTTDGRAKHTNNRLKLKMHRQVCDDYRKLDAARLPPVASDGRLRLLVISTEALGGKTYNRQLEHYTNERDDIDAVHLRVTPGLMMRVASHGVGVGRLKWRGIGAATLVDVLLRRTIKRLLRSGRFDAVHATRQPTAVSAARYAGEAGVLFSVTADSTVPCYSRDLLKQTEGSAAGPCPQERMIFSAADVISPYSDWVADSLQVDYGIGGERVHIVRPAPPPTYRQERVADHADRMPVILFVGNDHVRKGLPELLRWHQARWADRCQLQVVSARAGAQEGARNVEWLGNVPYDKVMREVMPGADIFVVPTHLDTYGQVYIEAMVCGVPAVGSRMAAIPEIIEDGVTGFTAEKGNDAEYIAAVEKLLDDPNLRRTMANACLERAARVFDSDRNFNGFLDLIKERANEKKVGRSG